MKKGFWQCIHYTFKPLKLKEQFTENSVSSLRAPEMGFFRLSTQISVCSPVCDQFSVIKAQSQAKKKKQHPVSSEQPISRHYGMAEINQTFWMESKLSAAAAAAVGQKGFLADWVSASVCEWNRRPLSACFCVVVVVVVVVFITTHPGPRGMNLRFTNYIQLIASVFVGSRKDKKKKKKDPKKNGCCW